METQTTPSYTSMLRIVLYKHDDGAEVLDHSIFSREFTINIPEGESISQDILEEKVFVYDWNKECTLLNEVQEESIVELLGTFNAYQLEESNIVFEFKCTAHISLNKEDSKRFIESYFSNISF